MKTTIFKRNVISFTVKQNKLFLHSFIILISEYYRLVGDPRDPNIGIEDSQRNRIVDQSKVLIIRENYIIEQYDRPNRLETLEAEPEEEVGIDEKGPYILQSEVEKAIKKMRNKKATGDDDVPGDVLKLLGGGLKITTKLINTIYEAG